MNRATEPWKGSPSRLGLPPHGQQSQVGPQAGEDAPPVAGAAADQDRSGAVGEEERQLAAVVSRAALEHGPEGRAGRPGSALGRGENSPATLVARSEHSAPDHRDILFPNGMACHEQAGVQGGKPRTLTPCPQSTVSPPVTTSSCCSGTPLSRKHRALSGEATTVAPVRNANASEPNMVEVGMAHEDEVGGVDLGGGQPDRIEAG